jgi:hypothetical protein
VRRKMKFQSSFNEIPLPLKAEKLDPPELDEALVGLILLPSPPSGIGFKLLTL